MPTKRWRGCSNEVEGYADIVLVRDIPFYSHCEHHIVPFFGKAHIGYYPRRRRRRAVEARAHRRNLCRRLQTQEAMTAQIVNAIEKGLKPRGVAVMIEAEHMCMAMRGVKKQGASTVTTQFTGVFRDDVNEQNRFFNLLRSAR